MSLSRQIAEYVSNIDPTTVPAAVIDEARWCLIDWTGVTLAGSVEPGTAIAEKVISGLGGSPQASLIGLKKRVAVTQAAFVNGIAGHVLNFDDMSPTYIGHNTSLYGPVAIGVGEFVEASGLQVLVALVVGWEVSCALGRGTIAPHYERGWHASGTIGLLGAAATGARLLELSTEKTMHALGIAASAASGLRANLGTLTNLFHIGHAAEQGVLAALLAREGWTSSEQSLEGFFTVLAEGYTPEENVAQLGKNWAILDPGVSRKRYPTCGAVHPTFDALLDIIRLDSVRADAVDSVHCRITPAAARLLSFPQPSNVLEARYSLPFAVAVALVDGEVGLDQFTHEKIQDPAVQKLMKRVSMEVDSSLACPNSGADFTTTLTMTLRDSRVLSRHVPAPRGPMTTTMTRRDLAEKFRCCAREALNKLRKYVHRHAR